MAKKSKPKAKTKPKKQKFGYVRPEWSTFYKKSQASKKAWETRKAKPSYNTPEQMQARREASRKGYAKRAGIFYEPEIIPKYGIPEFISEKFKPITAKYEATKIRKEYESDLKRHKSLQRHERETQEFAREKRDMWVAAYWSERYAQENFDYDFFEPDNRPTQYQIEDAKNSIQWVGDKETVENLATEALEKYEREKSAEPFRDYLRKYANEYISEVRRTFVIENDYQWIKSQFEM